MFDRITKGATYSRHRLAELWGYATFHPLARGVVTPRGKDKIILFVTEEKQTSQEQYRDRLQGGQLSWEGPTDHFAEQRMLSASKTGDQIHLFHRIHHRSDFTYIGQLSIVSHQLHANKPSSFVFSGK